MADPAAAPDQPSIANPVANRTIGDHGIIGNLDTAALVALDGTIDYLCWPHLDSPTVFAALLDPETGGEFALEPRLDAVRRTQIYLPDTNVLLTRWPAMEGSAEVTDLMPHPEVTGSLQHCLIRRVRATRGRVVFRLRCRPRFAYARRVPDVAAVGKGAVFSGGDAPPLLLCSDVPLQIGEGEATAEFALEAGEEAYFVLRPAEAGEPGRDEVMQSIDRSVEAWRRWVRRSTYKGRWREHVTRSALALKLLTSHAHGSIAAAATFGLPEASGAGRNWDYRASWVRDASFTVYAFMRLGYVEEAEAFHRWIGQRISAADRAGSLRVMYALDGSEAADETELPHLAGYGGARPVRIGNAAHAQTQLDIYGELMDSVYLSNKYGSAISHAGWKHVCAMVEQVREHWRGADAGIWEIRDEPRQFLHSRLMCWVAIDRALRLARKRSLPAPLVHWTRERDAISADIWEHFRHPQRGHFVQSRGGTELDASLLMMPLVRFVSATDPVWLATLDAIGEQLTDDGLVFRYRHADGLQGGEGAFTTCIFWYVECLARAGRLDEAQLLMEKALSYANHLGLFAEELSLVGEPLGNFPQGLTHLGLISAAYFLDRRLSQTGDSVWQP
jgi:GH15 family glucan-1,4-alpha-glucosidase